VGYGGDRGEVGGGVPLDDLKTQPAAQAFQVDRNAAAGETIVFPCDQLGLDAHAYTLPSIIPALPVRFCQSAALFYLVLEFYVIEDLRNLFVEGPRLFGRQPSDPLYDVSLELR